MTQADGEREYDGELEKLRGLQERFCEELRADIIRLKGFVSAEIGDDSELDVFGLMELKKKLERQLRAEAAVGRSTGVLTEDSDCGGTEMFKV